MKILLILRVILILRDVGEGGGYGGDIGSGGGSFRNLEEEVYRNDEMTEYCK